jgi:hypothetical protein
MKRTTTTTLLSIATLAISVTLALPAGAQATTAAPAPPAPAPAPAVQTSTTTTTGNDTTAGPSAPEPRDRGTVTVTRSMTPNRPWLIIGGSLLVGSYVPTAVISGTQGRQVEDANLMIPVAGPWLNLADRRCDGCSGETGNIAMVIGSGVLQGVGAGMMIMSFFIPEKVEAATIQAGPVKLHVGPTQVGRSGMGLGTVGVF